MKKLAGIFAFLLISLYSFAADFQITKVEYTLNPSSWSFLPTTKQELLDINVPVDKNRLFSTKEELEAYISDYKQRLYNTRVFDSIDVQYSVEESKEINSVTLKVETTDTVSMLAVPYPNYNSNSGLVLKIKAKDANFLGTMNTMSTDLNIAISNEKDVGLGINFNFDYPFKAGIFNMIWLNDLGINYTFGEDMPEWGIKTGLLASLPKDNISYQLKITQAFNNNLDYKVYNDNMYFDTVITFQTPVKLYMSDSLGAITTTPYITYDQNWDFNGITEENASLSSPSLSFGNTLRFGRVNWKNNFRTGLQSSLNFDVDYNFQREIWYPSVTFEVQSFKGFSFSDKVDCFTKLGICTDFFTYYEYVEPSNPFFNTDGIAFGSRLRGIKDSQVYDNYGDLGNSTTTPALICFNIDFPWHIFSTNFTKGFMRHFNFDFQISPFIDMALIYNKATGKYFDPKDGFYSAGLEILVYPKKWSSFTVRGSIGYDIGRGLLGNYINTDWRQDVSKTEITVGIGLHY